MRSNFCRRLGSSLCAIAVVLWLSAAFFITSAASGNGTLNLICKSDSEPIYGMNWSIYRVGELASDDKIEFQGDFGDYPVYLPDIKASSLQNAANTLENYAVLDAIVPTAYGTSDAGGNVNFTGLEDGIYLVSGERLFVGSKVYTPTPMFVEITNDGDITATAKFTVRDRPTVNEQMYNVRKVWQFDDSYIELRPIEINVEIYRDNVYQRTITLNRDNEWTYQWTGDASSVWRVKEVNIDRAYKVVYRHNETQYILVNSRDVLYNTTTTTPVDTTTTTTDVFTTTTISSETTTDTTTTITVTTTSTSLFSTSPSTTTTTVVTGGGKLPQTGQLWWPVPVCGAAGLILFTVGWRLNKKK